MGKENQSFLRSFIALLLVALCLVAANWQYQRGAARHNLNSQIIANLSKPKLHELPTNNANIANLAQNEWRTIAISGVYLVGNDLLQKNSYFDGQYGYQYLTQFRAESGQILWIDRGWVKAGADARTKPKLPETTTDVVSIEGRIRSGNTMLQGRFFALPSKPSNTDFKIDLLMENGISISHPAQLPTLSDGPHYAYALQWIFFASLVIYGRILIRRQTLSSK